MPPTAHPRQVKQIDLSLAPLWFVLVKYIDLVLVALMTHLSASEKDTASETD